MQSLESVFVREFKGAIKNPNKLINNIPLPKEDWEVCKAERFRVKDIENSVFTGLNNSIVTALPNGTKVSRRVIDKVSRAYKKDDNGNFLVEEYTVPSGSMVVLSSIKLGIPFNAYLRPSEGFGYVDFMRSKDGSVEYLYVVPKKYLYRAHQTALAVSVSNNLRCYEGKGFQSWKNGVVFIKIIPYSPNRSFKDSKILKTGIGLNYSKECQELLKLWVESGFIPNPNDCILDSDGSNIALTVCNPMSEGYIPFDVVPVGEKELYNNNAVYMQEG